MHPTADLTAAASVIEAVANVVGKGTRSLAALGGPDTQQVLAYDIAHASAALHTARSMLDYGAKGDDEARLTCAFVADMAHEVASRLLGRESMWGVSAEALSSTTSFIAAWRDPEVLAALAETPGPRHLDGEYEMVQDTFRSFANKEIAPRAEHVHRHNADVPEEIIAGLAEIGAFGLSVPSEDLGARDQ